jgi:CxxC-x17-CxxC domain-containing protein
MVQRRRHGRFHAPRPNHLRRPNSYKVVCSGCGKEVITQVPAPNDKKLLCTECFSRIEISKEET